MTVAASVRFFAGFAWLSWTPSISSALFSSLSLEQDRPRCVSEFLQLSLTNNKGLPRHLCITAKQRYCQWRRSYRSCTRKLSRSKAVSGRGQRTPTVVCCPPSWSLHTLLQSGNWTCFRGLALFSQQRSFC